METTKKIALTVPEQQLLELMQEINFGYILDLKIQAGRPVMTPRPRVIYGIKIGGENGRRSECHGEGGDFQLRHEVMELLGHFHRINHGKVHELVIKHGLPFSLNVEALGADRE